MPQIHNLEKEQFEKLFKQERIAHFEKRFAILDAFLKTENHVTVADLQNMLGDGHPDFTFSFIEETMELMALFGFARKNRFEDGEVRYEHLHLWQHHDHMICTKCGRIMEFEDPALERRQLEVARSRGFHMLQHKMELYGICARCLKDRLAIPLPLSACRPGERLVIRAIAGGTGSRMRLFTMGLRIGDQVEIITNTNQGQVVIAAEFKRYVLGRGLADKIQVEPVSR